LLFQLPGDGHWAGGMGRTIAVHYSDTSPLIWRPSTSLGNVLRRLSTTICSVIKGQHLSIVPFFCLKFCCLRWDHCCLRWDQCLSKKNNWQEANQLANNKHDRGVELRPIVEQLKCGSVTTRPRCRLPHN